ncbi:MAG TPA: CocE/NonD family hydrolase [Kineosporiaceae bacterium]
MDTRWREIAMSRQGLLGRAWSGRPPCEADDMNSFSPKAVMAGAAAVVALTATVTVGYAAAEPPASNLVDSTQVAHLTSDQLKPVLAGVPFDTASVRYGVTGYRLRYHTTGPDGQPTIASGLVMIPDGGPRKLPVVMWEHGTRAARNGVASMRDDQGDREATELFASAGYLTVAPDYLGLGAGEGHHPYLDTATAVSASADMLRATTAFTDRSNGTVRISGFSQGGAVTMAMSHAVPGVTALAPISGPYDLIGTEFPALVDHLGDGPGQVDPKDATFYIAYWTVAKNRLHHLYSSPAEVFQAPYDKTVEGLFDGSHDDDAIATALPGSPTQLLTPQYLTRLRKPTDALRAAIDAGDGSCRQDPTVPIRLFAADGDRDVPIANTQACLSQLSGKATVVNVGDANHDGSAIRSAPLVLKWFLDQDR